MKYAFVVAALLAGGIAAPAFAGEGNLSPAQLRRLGLSSMTVMSDEEGQQVRGLSGNAGAMGLSLISGLLIDPATKSFVFGSSADMANANAENAGLQVFTFANINHASTLNLALTANTDISSFLGIIVGGAGGNAVAGSQ